MKTRKWKLTIWPFAVGEVGGEQPVKASFIFTLPAECDYTTAHLVGLGKAFLENWEAHDSASDIEELTTEEDHEA